MSTEKLAEGWPEIEVEERGINHPWGGWVVYVVRCGGLSAQSRDVEAALRKLKLKLEISKLAQEAE